MGRFAFDTLLDSGRPVAPITTSSGMGDAANVLFWQNAAGYSARMSSPLREKIVPNWHFNHIPDHVLPALLAAGVTEDQVHAMTVDNPRRIFEKQGAY